MCPHGVDSSSDRKSDKKLRLTVDTTGGAVIKGGALLVSFHAHSVEFELPLADATSAACTRIFKRFQNLGELVMLFSHRTPESTADADLCLTNRPASARRSNGQAPSSRSRCTRSPHIQS